MAKTILVTGFPHSGTTILRAKIGECKNAFEHTTESHGIAINANNKKYAPVLLSKGGKEDFFVMFDEVQGAGDMQKKGFTIKWNDSFKETKLLPIKGTQIKMVKESEKQ